jgi:hypothetical protein
VVIQCRLLEVRIGDTDRTKWTISNLGMFVSDDTWELMRKKKPDVLWWPIVYEEEETLGKHLFYGWLC